MYINNVESIIKKTTANPLELMVKIKNDDCFISDIILSYFFKLCDLYGVSVKELTIGRMLLMGLNNVAIARITDRSIKTISAQKTSLFKKMDVKNETSLMALIFYHFLMDNKNL